MEQVKFKMLDSTPITIKHINSIPEKLSQLTALSNNNTPISKPHRNNFRRKAHISNFIDFDNPINKDFQRLH